MSVAWSFSRSVMVHSPQGGPHSRQGRMLAARPLLRRQGAACGVVTGGRTRRRGTAIGRQALRQRADSWVLEEIDHGEIVGHGRRNSCVELDQLEGRAPQIKKVVVQTHGSRAENLAPDLEQ